MSTQSFHAMWDKINGPMYRSGRPTEYDMADYSKAVTLNPVNNIEDGAGHELRPLDHEDMGRYGTDDVVDYYIKKHGKKNPLRLGEPMSDDQLRKFYGQR